MCSKWVGYLTPEVIIILFYYFSENWVTAEMYFSVFAIFEKTNRSFKLILMGIIINEIVLLPWQLLCVF